MVLNSGLLHFTTEKTGTVVCTVCEGGNVYLYGCFVRSVMAEMSICTVVCTVCEGRNVCLYCL